MGRYYNPVRTYFGTGEVKNLSEIMESIGLNVERVLLLTRGNDFSSSKERDIVLDQLSNVEIMEIEFMFSNPDIVDLYDLLVQTKGYDYDIVIAVGGGSVLDMGKTLAGYKGMELNNYEEIRNSIKNKTYKSNKKSSPWVGIPTTSGTGSEVTPWAAIWDREKNLKYSIEDGKLYAMAAIIDPQLTMDLPLKISVSTALDALSHATEAYWSKNTNEISRIYALTSIENIINHIEKLIEDPNDIFYRERIAMGSFTAGLAFSNTRTTACHSISYPITLMFGVDHGIATVLTLPRIMKHNKDALIEKEKLFNAFQSQNCEEISSRIENILTKTGLSPRLSFYGIKEDDLTRVVDKAYTKGRMDNNPVFIEKEELLDILKQIH